MTFRGSRLWTWPLVCGALLVSGCIVIVHRFSVESVGARPEPYFVRSPVRAHLLDGTTVLYRNGLNVGDTLTGPGQRYDITGAGMGTVGQVPLDSVIGMETFRDPVEPVGTVLLSAVGTAAGALGAAVLAVAIFGSCPTIYSDSAGSFGLEAEAFSYSVAPLLESRDVDRLRARQDASGRLMLEVRNEALETHYLNHLEILAVEHSMDEEVHAVPGGGVLAARSIAAPAGMVDRSGREVSALLRETDQLVYSTPEVIIRNASASDLWDFVDVMIDEVAGEDSVAVLLRLRNSLLTTVLFYDAMLANSGARSLDWLGRDLEELSHATALGRWYVRNFGLRLAVEDDGAFREIARIPDSGPIAWKEIAITVPTNGRSDVRLRLSFIADEWRIDRVRIAHQFRRPEMVMVRPAAVVRADDERDDFARAALLEPDDNYLVTMPGQRFTLHFDAGIPSAGGVHTFLLSSQGYYVEWVRPRWIREARSLLPFSPSDSTLPAVIRRWVTVKDSLEQLFYATRIPVR